MTKATSRLLLPLFIVLAGFCLPGVGQGAQKPLAQMPASARQLIAIKVTGSKRFPEEAIAAATGLQMGATVNDDDFKKAARRLGDMGVFTDIAYTFSYSSAGTKLELHVTDVDKFVPARFEDFVWFSDAELRQRIKEHSPLFDGELPLSGRLADEVSDVLQAMLVENSIPGHVEYQRAGKADGPIEAINYRVTDVLIRVRNIEFTGAGAARSARPQGGRREASRPRIFPYPPESARPAPASSGLLRARISEGGVRRASAQGREAARCRKRRRATQPDCRRRNLCRYARPAVQAEKLGLVREPRVPDRHAAENDPRRARPACQHRPHRATT